MNKPKKLRMKRTLTRIKKIFCYHKLDWENGLLNWVGKGPFNGHNKALVNTLLWISNHMQKFRFIVFIIYANVKYV